ncbi:MAG: hypothetical protein FJY82_13815 [Candidatus Aminicenantes bacterium]|nr:hypothetical protein [Candidatus Aminicenantes bacterium]
MSDPKGTRPGLPLQGDPLEERILRRIPVEITAASAVLAVPVGLVFGLPAGGLFLGGGWFAALSFLFLKSSLGRVLGSGGGGKAEAAATSKGRTVRAGIALYALRMALILGVFFLIMLAYPRKILAFAAGFSTILPVFIVEAAVTLARVKPSKPSQPRA